MYHDVLAVLQSIDVWITANLWLGVLAKSLCHHPCAGGGDAVPRVWARAAAHADHGRGGPGVRHPRRRVGRGARLKNPAQCPNPNTLNLRTLKTFSAKHVLIKVAFDGRGKCWILSTLTCPGAGTAMPTDTLSMVGVHCHCRWSCPRSSWRTGATTARRSTPLRATTRRASRCPRTSTGSWLLRAPTGVSAWQGLSGEASGKLVPLDNLANRVPAHLRVLSGSSKGSSVYRMALVQEMSFEEVFFWALHALNALLT